MDLIKKNILEAQNLTILNDGKYIKEIEVFSKISIKALKIIKK